MKALLPYRSASIRPRFDAPYVLLEIPGDIAQLRQNSPSSPSSGARPSARLFRPRSRPAIVAVQFIRDDSRSQRRSFYVLERV